MAAIGVSGQTDYVQNYCINLASAPERAPWCYTTDTFTRWEYCDPIGIKSAKMTVSNCSKTCTTCDNMTDSQCTPEAEVSVHDGGRIGSSENAFVPLAFNGVTDYRMKQSAPENSFLCGVKLGSFNWSTNGVSKMWLKWCNKYKWATQTEQQVWEDQNAFVQPPANIVTALALDSSALTFGSVGCTSDSQCKGDLKCQFSTTVGESMPGIKNQEATVPVNTGYCVYPQTVGDTEFVMCPSGQLIDGW